MQRLVHFIITKNQRFKIGILIIFVLAWSNFLNAQEDQNGFYEGRFFLELGIGTGFNIYGAPPSDLGDPFIMPDQISFLNLFDTIGYYTLFYGSSEDIFSNIVLMESRPDAFLQSRLTNYSVEYAYSDHFSVGFQVMHYNYDIHKAALSKSIVLLYAPYDSLISDLVAIETILPLIRFKFKVAVIINSAEFIFKYHPFSEQSWDPYVGVHAGYGLGYGDRLYADQVVRSGALTGIRFFITPNWTTSLEIDYSEISNKSDSSWNIKEESAQIKFGYAF